MGTEDTRLARATGKWRFIICLKFSIIKRVLCVLFSTNLYQVTPPCIKPQLPTKPGSCRLQGLFMGHEASFPHLHSGRRSASPPPRKEQKEPLHETSQQPGASRTEKTQGPQKSPELFNLVSSAFAGFLQRCHQAL